ncbi:MAG TPA: hypothetical protein ENL46_01960 [Candidatus Aminicenantes bacterium]|nr:hypothetical protein [Candidatus Aminicenantes bacterium]
MSKKRKKPVCPALFALLAAVSLLCFSAWGFYEKVEGVVAVVNDEVITLTDLRIAKAFGLWDSDEKRGEGSLFPLVLENIINQKLVNQFTGGDVNIDDIEIDGFMAEVKERWQDHGFEERLNDFGIGLTDLRNYCAEYLSYKKIVSDRFSRSVVVSLREIEEYYNQVYVPEQKANQEPVKQMVDMLPEIESAVKEKATSIQVEEWISSLRNKAEIQNRIDKYLDFLNGRGK